ncbi:hypothetical protein [Gilvimarinus chinensis]|uniref:hypothetical protein n=1 Tax=Gilvimarinus chinensis TaxID=396005 RepID=UPI00037298B3|nr:hypothetical protein [Gilvimarinus chinensis]
MTAQENIISVNFDVRKRIDEGLDRLIAQPNFSLPNSDHPLVKDYVRKIEGSYDVTRSKLDTDNAIDLLYIAYNTTPQTKKNIRTQLDKLMTRLISAQQQSELKMSAAVTSAATIEKDIRGTFKDWSKVKNSTDKHLLVQFVGEDLVDLAEDIKNRAERISQDLNEIADVYEEIIEDTTKSTHDSEKALADELQNKAEIEQELAEKEAERQKLESLVEDLKTDIKKYEKMANEYKTQAETAEERAFVMSIVQVGAQMISAAIPAITTALTGAATGGASLVAASAINTTRQLTNSEAASTDDDDAAKAIEVKKEIADKKSEVETAEREIKELVEKKQALEDEKEAVADNDTLEEDAKEAEVESIEKRIDQVEQDIKKKNKKVIAAKAALEGAKEAFKALDKGMGDMAKKQEQQATSLRELQMKMLDKVELYEAEKRTQAAELVKIKALLSGKRTKEETIKLAIQSLGLSLKALKRAREIIIEIAFFFNAFSSYMHEIMEQAQNQANTLEKAKDRSRVSARVIRTTNDFFASQSAQWQAVEVVSSKFEENFTEGWSRLNALTGHYLTGDELTDYLHQAANQIDQIARDRKQASLARTLELQHYRDQINAQG